MPITEAVLRKVALSFPGAREEPSYGQPAFKIEKKFFVRLRKEDASIVWVVDSIDERDALLEMDPETYFITDHYRNYPSVLVRIARLNETMLRKMLERRWRAVAPKNARKARDATPPKTEPKPATKRPR
ncbi:MAG: MmcQ/YjbR family DNA-binding protein [Rhizomicrobium sp.]